MEGIAEPKMNRRQAVPCSVRFSVFERDSFRCVYCGKSAKDGMYLSVSFQPDHLYPRTLGGLDVEDNLVTSCADCNLGKSDRVLETLPDSIPSSVANHFATYREENKKEDSNEPSYFVIDDVFGLSPWDTEVITVALIAHHRQRIFSALASSVSHEGMETENGRSIFNVLVGWRDRFPDVPVVAALFHDDRGRGGPRLDFLQNLFVKAGGLDDHGGHVVLRVSYVLECCRRRLALRRASVHSEVLIRGGLSVEEEARLLEELVAERRRSQGMKHSEADNGR